MNTKCCNVVLVLFPLRLGLTLPTSDILPCLSVPNFLIQKTYISDWILLNSLNFKPNYKICKELVVLCLTLFGE